MSRWNGPGTNRSGHRIDKTVFWFALLALLSLAVVVIGGCGETSSTTAGGSGAAQVVKIQGLNGGMSGILCKVLETEKIAEKHGFTAEYSYFDPDAATNAFLLKQSDISIDIDIFGVAIARNAGHMVASFYPLLNNNSSIIVKEDSPYQTPKDLVGKKVGHFGSDSGTTSVMTVLLKKLYDIDVLEDYELVTAGPGALVDLFDAGEVEAIFDFSPHTERALTTADGRVLFCAATSGAYAPPLVTVAAYEDWLKNNKELAYKVRAAVEEAYQMFVDSEYALLSEEPYRALLNQPDPKVVEAVVKRANEIPLMTNDWSAEARTNADSLLQYMGENNILLDKAPGAGCVISLEEFLGPQGQ